MPYIFPTIEDLISDAQADVSGSDLPNADGFLPRAILPLMAMIQAGFALGHYDAIAYAMLQATPFTATDEWLDTWAAFKAIYRKDATAAGYTGSSMVQFTGAVVDTDMPSGTPIQRGDGFAYVTTADAIVQSSGTVTAPIVATTTGSAGNAAAGIVLTLGTGITGIPSAGTASTIITGGTEQELDDDLRTRMLFAYANPPAGGDQADYETWATAVPGVTRAWCQPNGMGAGTVVIQFMMDIAEASFGGFPQGTNGVAALETRDTVATGDQLSVANAIYPLRPVTSLIYLCAPVPEPVTYAIADLYPNTATIQAGITTALQAMHLRKAIPGGTLWPSDWNEAIAAVPGISHFAVASPSAGVTSGSGQLLTVGTVTYAS
jgi:uncharacterized phage protein gp47/JayE